MFYANQSNVDDHEQKQEEWLLKAAHQGNIQARTALISFYQKKSDKIEDIYNENDKKQAIEANKKLEKWLIEDANQGDVTAEYELALYYMNNYDVSVHNKAVEWIEKVANQGLIEAQVRLGKWYLEGANGVNKNYNKAKAIFQNLADKGNVDGLYYLGLCYRLGYGVVKDESKAIELNKLAADKGNIMSAAYLSIVYLTGIDHIVFQDREEFKSYYNQVCSSGLMECLKLQTSIVDACSKMYPNSEYMSPDFDIDPDCLAVMARMMKMMNSFSR